MRVTTLNNAELVIQANVGKQGDWEAVQAVAQRLESSSWVDVVVAREDESEQWVHLTACWDNYQAKDLKAAYKEAKRGI